MALRFDDATGVRPHYLWDFVARALVECPRCQSCAVVECEAGLRGAPTLVCSACGLSRRGWPSPTDAEISLLKPKRCSRCNDWLGKAPVRFLKQKRVIEVACPCGAVSATRCVPTSMVLGGAFDPYFRLPLWLQAEVQGHVLWAYNRDHLSFLEAFVRADTRARAPNWNSSLVSRLPRWLKVAAARQPVLRAIAKIARR